MENKQLNQPSIDSLNKKELLLLMDSVIARLREYVGDTGLKVGQEVFVASKYQNHPAFLCQWGDQTSSHYEGIVGELAIVSDAIMIPMETDENGNDIPFISVYLKGDGRKRKTEYAIHPEDAIPL